eukprot:TRINITY_DN43998_c0_g1_i2.p1 TRINITY_DN43998_c0_g1~~TRINITY_DN43998_c0_g1_i2.p1  ORF type:complete len:425 (-),score=102.06 TRINITY_DN43998_c0_g1_i2:144-1418(-)
MYRPERIVCEFKREKKKMYTIRWQGGNADDDTEETASDVQTHFPDVVRAWKSEKEKKKKTVSLSQRKRKKKPPPKKARKGKQHNEVVEQEESCGDADEESEELVATPPKKKKQKTTTKSSSSSSNTTTTQSNTDKAQGNLPVPLGVANNNNTEHSTSNTALNDTENSASNGKPALNNTENSNGKPGLNNTENNTENFASNGKPGLNNTENSGSNAKPATANSTSNTTLNDTQNSTSNIAKPTHNTSTTTAAHKSTKEAKEKKPQAPPSKENPSEAEAPQDTEAVGEQQKNGVCNQNGVASEVQNSGEFVPGSEEDDEPPTQLVGRLPQKQRPTQRKKTDAIDVDAASPYKPGNANSQEVTSQDEVVVVQISGKAVAPEKKRVFEARLLINGLSRTVPIMEAREKWPLPLLDYLITKMAVKGENG